MQQQQEEPEAQNFTLQGLSFNLQKANFCFKPRRVSGLGFPKTRWFGECGGGGVASGAPNNPTGRVNTDLGDPRTYCFGGLYHRRKGP